MPFSIRPFRRFPVQCSVTYNAGPLLKQPLAYFTRIGSLPSGEYFAVAMCMRRILIYSSTDSFSRPKLSTPIGLCDIISSESKRKRYGLPNYPRSSQARGVN